LDSDQAKGKDMSKRNAIVIPLIVVSFVVMIFKAETTYQNLTGASKWSHAFGYAFFPWLMGLIVALVREGYARIRRRRHDATRALLWATGAFAVLMIVATISTRAEEQKRESVRNDAMLLMGAGAWVPGIAAYCNKYVAPNRELLEAAAAWNKRHESELEQTIRAIKWAGGMSEEEKDLIDRMAFYLLKKEVEAQTDKAGYCQQMAQAFEQGVFDLEGKGDTAPALGRIMGLEIR
jgi:hypothetical protein